MQKPYPKVDVILQHLLALADKYKSRQFSQIHTLGVFCNQTKRNCVHQQKGFKEILTINQNKPHNKSNETRTITKADQNRAITNSG